ETRGGGDAGQRRPGDHHHGAPQGGARPLRPGAGRSGAEGQGARRHRDRAQQVAMRALVRGATRVLEALTLVGISVVSLTVVVEVVLRYGFGSSLIFTEELTRYTMIWVAFLGGVVALRDGAHVATGGIGNRFGPRARNLASLVADALTVLFLLTLTWASIQTLPNQRDQLTTTLHVSIFWFYLALPVGAVLMVVVVIGRRFGMVTAESSDLPLDDL